jgi:hypothetical protein
MEKYYALLDAMDRLEWTQNADSSFLGTTSRKELLRQAQFWKEKASQEYR